MKKLMLIFTVSVSLISGCVSKEKQAEDSAKRVLDSMEKVSIRRKEIGDSIANRIEFIIQMCKAGATEDQANHLADSVDNLEKNVLPIK